jgi:DNA invertase Pin-like site-specific DNA recombinase
MSAARNPQATLMFGYCRVSTEEQAARGNGLDAQRAAIDAEAARRGWDVSTTATTA